MAINPKYQPPKTSSGDLKTPVIFYEYKPSNGPEPGEEKKSILHECTAELYNPSMKDIDIMKIKETNEAVTIRIRDTHGEYLPANDHKVDIDDYRYSMKTWEVIDVRPDPKDNRFITILLGVTT